MRRLGKVRFRGAWGAVKGSGGGSLGRRGNVYFIYTVSASTNSEHATPSASTNIYYMSIVYTVSETTNAEHAPPPLPSRSFPVMLLLRGEPHIHTYMQIYRERERERDRDRD
jgi:hypothetical protein